MSTTKKVILAVVLLVIAGIAFSIRQDLTNFNQNREDEAENGAIHVAPPQ